MGKVSIYFDWDSFYTIDELWKEHLKLIKQKIFNSNDYYARILSALIIWFYIWIWFYKLILM